MQRVFRLLQSIAVTAVMDLDDFMDFIIFGEEALKEESIRRFWNFLFMMAVPSFTKPERDRFIAR